MKNRHGCKYGLPHDLKTLYETPQIKVEKCQICNKRFRWNKGYRGRIDNKKYLEVHARNYAQRFGATKQLYMKLYYPEQTKIII